MVKENSYREITDDEVITLWYGGYTKKALITYMSGVTGLKQKEVKERLEKILYDDYMEGLNKSNIN